MSLRLLSKPIAAVSAVALGLGMLVGAAGFTASHAADNTGITIVNPKIQASDRDLKVDPTDPVLKVGNVARLSFDWDASTADPRSGQSFTIGFGDNFLGAPTSASKIDTFDLVLPTGEIVGDCKLTQPTFVCTFNNKLDELRAKGGIEVKGSAKILVSAIRENNDSFVNMNLNGSITRVGLPRGEALVRPGMTPYTAVKLSKSLVPTAANQRNLGYTISFSVEKLNEDRLKRGLAPLAGDGQTIQTIVLEDTLGPGQELGNNITLNRMIEGTRKDEPTGAFLPAWVASPLASILKGSIAEGFTVTADPQDFPGKTAVNITLTGPFKTGVVYTVVPSVHANTSPKGVIYGYMYSNAVTDRDTGVGTRAERALNAAAQVTVTMKQGWATMTLGKEVSGTGLGHIVDPVSPYEFDIAFTLPGDGVAADFDQAYRDRVSNQQATFEAGLTQEWPGVTFNPDKKGGKGTLSVAAGVTPAALAALPAGTTITITEKDRALTPGAQWKNPVFSIDGVDSAPSATKSHTMVLADRQVAKIRVKNTVEKQKGRLAIRKTTAGDGGKGATHAYTFEYACSDGTTGAARGIQGNGTVYPVNGANGQPLELPVGTKCTIAEDVTKAVIEGLSLENPPALAKVEIQDGQQAVAEFHNVYVPGVTFSVTKKVVGADPGAKKFKLSYVCAKGDKEIAGTLAEVGANGTAQSSLVPAGSKCSITEDIADAAIAGFDLAFSGPNGASLDVTVGGANTIEVTNTYTPRHGSIKISKQVNGLDGTPEADRSFEISVSCPSLAQPKVVNLKNGESATVDGLLEGERCKIAEVDADITKMDRETVITPTFVTIKHNDGTDESVAKVAVTNTYTPKPGSLTVTKNLDVAIGTPFANEKFTINVSCDSNPAINETLSLGHDEKKTISNIPAGSVCTVTEDAPDKDGYTKRVELPADTTIRPGEESSVVVTNIYDEKPGTLVIRKVLNDPKGAITAGTTFPISYECGPAITGTVNLAANAEHRVENVPAGLTCTVTETPTAVDGFTPRVDIQGSPVEITRNAASTVTVTNSYDEKPGTLVITKKLVDPNGAIAQGTTFPISYNCGDGANMSGTVNLAADGEHRVENIPAGRTCTVSEAATKVDGFTETVNIQGSPVQITRNANASVTVTNTYTRDTGSLVIAKNLVAPDNAPFAGHEFEIGYSCDADGFRNKTVNVAGGNSVTVDGIPSGTVCTVTETAPTFEGYTGAADIDHQQVAIAKGAASNVTVTNTYTRDKGSLSITKKVEAEDGAPFAGRAFDITYTCGDPANPVTTGTVSLANGASETISDIPTGTECVVEESVASAHQKGYANTVAIEPARQVIAKDAVAAVTVTNRYAPLSGSFVISKSVAGDGAEKAKGKTFTFDYECTDLYGASQGKKTVELADGANVSIDTRPGSCVISEQAAPIENTSHEVAFVVNGQDYGKGPITIDIPEAGEPVNVGVVNTYSLDRGIFTIAKTVTGVPSAASNTFEFDYVCTGGATGKVQVKGDGVPVQAGDPMPVGTECTFTENASVAEIPGYNLVVPDPQKGVISAQDDVVALEFLNAYSKKPVVTPEQPKPDQPKPEQPQADQGKTNPKAGGKAGTDSPKADASGKRAPGKLASTGSTAMTVVGTAAVALILGGLITWMVRRRK